MSSKRLTVGRVPRRESRTIPEIRFGGMWLSELGFSIGDHVRLALENGQIVIRLEQPPVTDEKINRKVRR